MLHHHYSAKYSQSQNKLNGVLKLKNPSHKLASPRHLSVHFIPVTAKLSWRLNSLIKEQKTRGNPEKSISVKYRCKVFRVGPHSSRRSRAGVGKCIRICHDSGADISITKVGGFVFSCHLTAANQGWLVLSVRLPYLYSYRSCLFKFFGFLIFFGSILNVAVYCIIKTVCWLFHDYLFVFLICIYTVYYLDRYIY